MRHPVGSDLCGLLRLFCLLVLLSQEWTGEDTSDSETVEENDQATAFEPTSFESTAFEPTVFEPTESCEYFICFVLSLFECCQKMEQT